MASDRVPVVDAVPESVLRARKRRRMAVWGVAVVVAPGAVGYGFASTLSHLGATVQRYFRTVASGDFAGACDMLTDSGRAKLMAQEKADTCEAAAEHWRASLSPAQRDWLAHGHVWVKKFAAEDSRKELVLVGNPLGISEWAIYKHSGRETISDWGPGSQKIPPSTD